MNVKEYILSGIVESYVLGLADKAEKAEFEVMCARHDEVRAARDAFELSLERQAMSGAISPSPELKTRLFAELSIVATDISAQELNELKNGFNEPKGSGDQINGLTDLPKVSGNSPKVFTELNRGFNDEDKDGNIANQPGGRVVSGTGWVKYLAAASVLLLVASTVLNFYLFRQYQDYSERYSSLLASQTQLANNNRVLQTSLDNFQKTIDLLKDPNTSVIKMAGNLVPNNGSPEPSSIATIYWNKKSSEVYLLVNSLPKPTSDKQYQLWAIVGGKPVSVGVFDMNQSDTMMQMAKIPNAEAFAVTLEKSGGSESPQGAMYVLGTT